MDYDEQRDFLGGYKTVLGKGGLQKVIGNDSVDGLISGPFSESELRRNPPPQVLLGSLGAEVKDLTRPDVRTLADAAQEGEPTHASRNANRQAQSCGRHAHPASHKQS